MKERSLNTNQPQSSQSKVSNTALLLYTMKIQGLTNAIFAQFQTSLHNIN